MYVCISYFFVKNPNAHKIFQVARPARRHYNKEGVTAVEEIPLLPDDEQWKYSYAQVIFDSDPTPSIKYSSKYQEWAMAK